MENLSFSRRQALLMGAATLLAPKVAIAAKAHPVLIELFTSQGCSSCPPADALAADLVNDPNNIVLSFNVDYWDYLGWRDTLAKPEYTQRQYDYARSRGDGSVYTPQMIVQGGAHVVGNSKRKVSNEISESQAQSLVVDIDLFVSDQKISVSIPAAEFQGEATLWLMAVEPRVKQKIERGENSGRDIEYVNVVRNLVPAAMWSGEKYEGTWMRDVVMTKGTTALVAVLQSNKVGKVLGLART
jgi:hypothetical protein